MKFTCISLFYRSCSNSYHHNASSKISSFIPWHQPGTWSNRHARRTRKRMKPKCGNLADLEWEKHCPLAAELEMRHTFPCEAMRCHDNTAMPMPLSRRQAKTTAGFPNPLCRELRFLHTTNYPTVWDGRGEAKLTKPWDKGGRVFPLG